jgi:hypothetical protein
VSWDDNISAIGKGFHERSAYGPVLSAVWTNPAVSKMPSGVIIYGVQRCEDSIHGSTFLQPDSISGSAPTSLPYYINMDIEEVVAGDRSW